jgi:hypothetical protein
MFPVQTSGFPSDAIYCLKLKFRFKHLLYAN